MTLRWDTRSRAGQSVNNWINPALDIEYLIIGGGGGGGYNRGGGGGAGGYRSSVIGESTGGGGTLENRSSISIGAGTYTVVVGAGGAGATSNVTGTSGVDSSFAGLTSLGGGGGGGNSATSSSGGSGGGGGANGGGSVSGTSNQGFAGAAYDAVANAGGVVALVKQVTQTEHLMAEMVLVHL